MTHILTACLAHESHGFLDGLTPASQFKAVGGLNPKDGDHRGTGTTMDGFMQTAQAKGWVINQAAHFASAPSATADHVIVEEFLSSIKKSIHKHKHKLDGIFLFMHGAMLSSSCDDVEGLVLQYTRQLLKSHHLDIPIVCTLDLHGNISTEMVENSDYIHAFQKNPHTDVFEAGAQAAHCLERIFQHTSKPTHSLFQIPLIMPPSRSATANQPMRDALALARSIEANNPDIIGINIFAGFPYSDSSIVGMSICGASFGPSSALEAALHNVAELIWQQRHKCINQAKELPQVLESIAKESLAGPIILAEPADNIGGGAPGDHTDALRTLLASPFSDMVAVICDPEAVRQCHLKGVGSTLTLNIGGHSDHRWSTPIQVDATVNSISNGTFTLEDPQSHMASFAGQNIDMGDCAVIQLKNATILLTSIPTAPMDLGQLRSQGITPEKAHIILVKAAVSHRQAYDPIATHSFSINSRGPCSEDIKALPYSKLKHPMFPINTDLSELTNVNRYGLHQTLEIQ